MDFTLSSVGRSEARSLFLRESRTPTVSGSLCCTEQVLIFVSACGLLPLDVGVECVASANGRPSARRTVATRLPPEGRAGKQLHLHSGVMHHGSTTSDSINKH